MYGMCIRCEPNTVLGAEHIVQWERWTTKYAVVRLKGAMRRTLKFAVTGLRWMLHPSVRARMEMYSPRSLSRNRDAQSGTRKMSTRHLKREVKVGCKRLFQAERIKKGF